MIFRHSLKPVSVYLASKHSQSFHSEIGLIWRYLEFHQKAFEASAEVYCFPSVADKRELPTLVAAAGGTWSMTQVSMSQPVSKDAEHKIFSLVG